MRRLCGVFFENHFHSMIPTLVNVSRGENFQLECEKCRLGSGQETRIGLGAGHSSPLLPSEGFESRIRKRAIGAFVNRKCLLKMCAFGVVVLSIVSSGGKLAIFPVAS